MTEYQKTIHGIKIIFKPSKDGKSKYTAFFKEDGKDKKIKFGAIDYEHYYDKLGYYKSKNHLDPKRR